VRSLIPWLAAAGLCLPALLAGCTPATTELPVETTTGAGPETAAPGDAAPGDTTSGDTVESMPTEKTLIVGPELVECTGVAPMMCMQVKENPEDDWQLFYDQIEGFTHEPGFDTVLRVSVSPVPNAPADASSLAYSLIEVVSQTPAEESASGAGGSADSAEVVTPALEGPVWLLASYGDPGNPTPVLPESEITALFSAADGRVSGRSGCNNYFGSYTVDGDALTVGQLGSTMMACPEPLMQQEQAYLAALQGAETFSIEADTLSITGGGMELRFIAQPAGLAGTAWVITGFNNGREAVVSPIIDTTLTLEFGDTQISGNAGCNTYSGEYTTEGDTITIVTAAVTQRMCSAPEGVMEQEAEFLAALQTAATYRVQGSRLDMRTADDAMAISARSAPAGSAGGSGGVLGKP
jgi:heat shock protein HslJ